MPNVYIIAGPNGAGKTTFATQFLPDYVHCLNFINADLISGGLSPFNPASAAIKAGRLVLQQIDEYSNQGIDFAFETTLSGKSYSTRLTDLKQKDYSIHLFFLWVPSAGLSISRIKERVREGGHHVPSNDVRRRFKRSIENFLHLYEPLLDSWMMFDNSQIIPQLIAKRSSNQIEIIDQKIFQKIYKKGVVNGRK